MTTSAMSNATADTPPATTALNIPLLKRVRDQIRAEPNKFDMDRFLGKLDKYGQVCNTPFIPDNVCGTVACIAGWTIVLAAQDDPIMRTANYAGIFAVEAGRLLGLTDHQADTLFFSCHWPDPYQYKTRYSAALAILDRLIETGDASFLVND